MHYYAFSRFAANGGNMINKEKTALMTRMAIYEKNAGKEDMKLSRYYKTDYARMNVLRTVVAVTVAFVLIVAMLVLYRLEYYLDNALTIDYKALGLKLLNVYGIVLAVYVVLSFIGYSIRYSLSRKGLSEHYANLSKLKKFDKGMSPSDESEEEEL